MTFGGLSHILRGVGGQPEIGRVLLTLGGAVAIIAPVVFVAVDMAHGARFDVTAFCLAYPGGLGALITTGVLGIGTKDKNVASAIQTRDQTSAPAGTIA